MCFQCNIKNTTVVAYASLRIKHHSICLIRGDRTYRLILHSVYIWQFDTSITYYKLLILVNMHIGNSSEQHLVAVVPFLLQVGLDYPQAYYCLLVLLALLPQQTSIVQHDTSDWVLPMYKIIFYYFTTHA